jgi:hypothetical protein
MATDPQRQEHARKLGQVVAKAWTDEGFKRRLLADPKAVLAEQGIAVPAELEVRVCEDTERVHHLVLPRRPAEGELSDEQLAGAAGGQSDGLWGW